MEGFRAWLEERRAQWRAVVGLRAGAPLNYAEFRAFDAWLRTHIAERTGAGEAVEEFARATSR